MPKRTAHTSRMEPVSYKDGYIIPTIDQQQHATSEEMDGLRVDVANLERSLFKLYVWMGVVSLAVAFLIVAIFVKA